MNENFLKARELHTAINKMFADNKYDKKLESIIQKHNFNTTSEHLLEFHNSEICSVKDYKEYVDSTLELFKLNRANGKKLLSSLEKYLRNVLISIPLYKTGNGNAFTNIFMDTGLKYNVYSWIVLADCYPQVIHYSNALVVVPFETCQYPWYNTDTKRLNIKGIDYSRPCNIKYMKSESEEFNGKWGIDNDYNYAKEAIKKYIYKNKKATVDKFIKIKLKNSDIGTFSLAKVGCNLVFIGKTSDYLKLHKKYIE